MKGDKYNPNKSVFSDVNSFKNARCKMKLRIF